METFHPFSLNTLWSGVNWQANATVLACLVGAMFLGFVVGYERSYHGRAAGMRTYGLVCMSSAALTVVSSHPEFWLAHVPGALLVTPDPTRVIQGVITGVGFLCAGVIMKDGLNISGLTTSVSIWTAAAIGVMMGLGMYIGAVLITLLSLTCMMWISRIEDKLPSKPAIAVVLTFTKGFEPNESALRNAASKRGYDIAMGSFEIQGQDGSVEWRFVAIAKSLRQGETLIALSTELGQYEGIAKYHLSHVKN